MVKVIGRLNALSVKRLNAPGRYPDGGGLYLQISRNGGRSWVFRYMLHGRSHEMGLGAASDVTLKDARELLAEYRRQKGSGTDPLEVRRNKRREAELEAARALTFKQCAEAYIETNQKAWRNAKHAAQWPSTLKTYAYPVLSNLSVQAVDPQLVVKVLKPIWTSKPQTASRLRGRIEKILDWATSMRSRTGENPARWRGHLENLLAQKSLVHNVRHHKALPFEEIGKFMEVLRTQNGSAARALELLILTATRTSETINARWPEFDLAQGIWTIPAERTKTRKEHRIPLSGAAKNLLASLSRDEKCDLLFTGYKRGEPLCNMAMLALLRRMGYSDTVHGFRSTFRDWVAERTKHEGEVSEMALAHTIKNKVEAAYRRGDLFLKRQRLMEDWAKYIARPQTPKVVSIGKMHAASAVA